MPAQLVRQQSLAEIVLHEPEPKPQRAFTYFTYWMIVHGVACWLAGRRIPILAIELRCPQPDLRRLPSHVFRQPALRPTAHPYDLPLTASTCPSSAALKNSSASSPTRRPTSWSNTATPTASPHGSNTTSPNAPDTSPETEGLAATLCVSASTLRRRLAEEGRTYQGLKDSVRKELAIVWLAEPQISFAEIAARLGFADTSSFIRRFGSGRGPILGIVGV